MAKMLEVALWPRFLGCFLPPTLARLYGKRLADLEAYHYSKLELTLYRYVQSVIHYVYDPHTAQDLALMA